MDEVIQILGIIAAIIIFIVQAIRKTKGQPVKKNESVNSQLESLFGIVDEPKDEIFEKQETIPTLNIEKDIAQTPENEIVSKEVQGDIPDEIKKTEIKDIDNEKTAFNLREAVIYTEILNRKNF